MSFGKTSLNECPQVRPSLWYTGESNLRIRFGFCIHSDCEVIISISYGAVVYILFQTYMVVKIYTGSLGTQ